MNPRNRHTHAADVPALLARAVGLHQDGRLAEAAALYDEVLRRLPGQPDALHLLGLIKAQGGDLAGGIALIRRAVQGDGRQAVFHLNLGRLQDAAEQWADAAGSYAEAARLAPLEAAHHRLEGTARARIGAVEAASRAFRRTLLLVPDDADVALALADALYDMGRLLPAAAWYGRASALQPTLTLAHFNRGAALRDAGRTGEAVAAFRAAAATAPTLVHAHEQVTGLSHALGDARSAAAAGRGLLRLVPDHADAAAIVGSALSTLGEGQGGDRRGGIRWLSRAARLRPESADTPLTLGVLHQSGGDSAVAARWFRRALVLAPGSAMALSGLGLALAALGVADGSAERAALRAVRVAPVDADLAVNAGSVFHRLKQPARALSWHRRAVALCPGGVAGWVNIGTHGLDANAFEEALSVFERALALGTGEHEALAQSNRGVALMALGRLGEAVNAFRAALARAPQDAAIRSNMLFCLCFDDGADPAAVFAEHRRFERFVMPRPPAAPRFDATGRDPERRLRVGYLSPDFQRYPGPGYHFLLPLFERHDRVAVEVTAYYNDTREDTATARFKAAADRWRNCAALPDEALERLVREDGIDILVDCGGHMSRNRMPLFIRRPAPVQVSLPLYPNTTGLSAMDYQFADPRIAPPAADALHTERLIRLPGCVLCYRPADSGFAPPGRPPVEAAGVFTFGSFNNITKVNGATIALWARLLKAVPEARLMLKWRGLGTGSGLERRLLDAFAAHGVGDDRLVLRGTTPDPYQDHTRIDCALDPVFANGGTTICDALWMGVPVLGMAGQGTISRWSATMLGAVGLDALVTEREEDYLALGVRIATDRGFLAAQRNGLRDRMMRSPLMDQDGYARAVEAGYRHAWRRWCAGLPPEAVALPPEAVAL